MFGRQKEIKKVEAVAVFGRGLVWDKESRAWRTPSFAKPEAELFCTGDRLCLLAAAHLFKKHGSKLLIVCGGQPRSPACREDLPTLARVLESELLGLGIPADVIISDNRPCLLLEQLAAWQELLVRNGVKSSALVLNSYLLPRAKLLLRKSRDLVYLRRGSDAGNFQIVAAEKVAAELDPRWRAIIKSVYKSEAMKGLTAWEKEACRPLKKSF